MAAILENMKLLLLFSTYLISTSFISYESTLHSSLYLKAELGYIRFRFSVAISSAILENWQLLLLFSTYLISTFFISFESTLYSSLYLKAELRYIISYLVEAILISRIGRHIGRHFEKYSTDDIGIHPTRSTDRTNFRKNSFCSFVCSLQLEILRKMLIFP